MHYHSGRCAGFRLFSRGQTIHDLTRGSVLSRFTSRCDRAKYPMRKRGEYFPSSVLAGIYESRIHPFLAVAKTIQARKIQSYSQPSISDEPLLNGTTSCLNWVRVPVLSVTTPEESCADPRTSQPRRLPRYIPILGLYGEDLLGIFCPELHTGRGAGNALKRKRKYPPPNICLLIILIALFKTS